MRIGWIVPGDLDQPTGGYIYDRLIVQHLRAAGDDVVLSDFSDAEVLVGDGLAMRQLAGIFERSTAARVLLVHHLTSWELERTDGSVFRAAEARTIATSDGLIATSKASARRIASEHPSAPECEVVEPGADRLPRLPRAERGRDIRLCMVGSLIPRKRIPLVLDALGTLDDARISLRIVGDPTRDSAHARVIADRADPRITLLGVVDDATLASELARADALVLASSLEGYGMVVTEALHAGVPVIVSSEALASDLAGEAVVSFEDATELAKVLASLPDRLEGLQRAAESSDGAGVTWRQAGEAFRASLQRVIRRAGEARSTARDR